MTPKQEKLLTEKFIRPMVRKMLKEAGTPSLPKSGDKIFVDYLKQFKLISAVHVKGDVVHIIYKHTYGGSPVQAIICNINNLSSDNPGKWTVSE